MADMYTPILLIPALLITVYCHTPKNDSDVIVTYSGHAEAINPVPIFKPSTVTPITITKGTDKTAELVKTKNENTKKKSTPFYDEDTDSVVFIPNEKPTIRNRDTDFLQHEENRMSIKDIMTKGQSINDVLNDKRIVIETEPPKTDILFISGKNNEDEEPLPHKMKGTENKQYKTRRDGKTMVQEKTAHTNCKQLDCNNTIGSVCGGKMEHKLWRYRLFLNECFFNKVNCNFKYEENRYQQVPLNKCKNIAGHYPAKTPLYRPAQIRSPKPKARKSAEHRRTLASRRSFNKNLDGKFCSHICPSSCLEHYEPECAVSNNGERRVFMNHCKLDYNSCYYGTVWQRRPLAECVGGKKADLTKNSAFIGWMQRVGIVDNKGRLKLE